MLSLHAQGLCIRWLYSHGPQIEHTLLSIAMKFFEGNELT